MKQEDYFKYNFASQFANMISTSIDQANMIISTLKAKSSKKPIPEDLATIQKLTDELEVLKPKLVYYQREQAEIHDKHFEIAWDYAPKE